MWNKDYKRLKSDADIVILHRSLWKDNDSQIYKTGTAYGMIKFSDSTLFSLFDMARWMELPLISYYSLAVNNRESPFGSFIFPSSYSLGQNGLCKNPLRFFSSNVVNSSVHTTDWFLGTIQCHISSSPEAT